MLSSNFQVVFHKNFFLIVISGWFICVLTMCVWLDVLKLSIVLNVPVLLLPSLHDDILMLSCEGLGVQLDFYLVLALKHLFFFPLLASKIAQRRCTAAAVASCQSHWLQCQNDAFLATVWLQDIVIILRLCRGVGFYQNVEIDTVCTVTPDKSWMIHEPCECYKTQTQTH